MAYKAQKTEMKGTGGGRWTTRAEAKTASDKIRRRYDKLEAKAGEERYVDFDEDTDCHGVFGTESGFCYSLHADEGSANDALKGV